jgi:hypothetical protein
MALSLIFDHAQMRVDQERVCVFFQASRDNPNGVFSKHQSQWSEIHYSDFFIDPITLTGMLCPAPEYDDWYTSSAGIYAKLGIADLALSGGGSLGANWREQEPSGRKWLWNETNAASPEGVVTVASYLKNRAFFIAFFAHGDGSDFEQFLCGWNSTADYLSGVGLRFFSSGEVFVYKDGVIVGTGKITGGASRQKMAGQWVEVYLIPFRRKELLVLSKNGDGFTVILEDIADDDPDPTITPATNFWAKVPAGTCSIQMAPLQFSSAGSACSKTLGLAEPRSGTPTYEAVYDPPFAGTTSVALSLRDAADPSLAYDGLDQTCRMKFDLTGDGAYTPFVYAGTAEFEPVLTTTADEPVDLTDKAQSIELSVPENPSGVELNVEFLDPDALGLTGVLAHSNRPVKLLVGSVIVFGGRTEPAEYDPTAFAESSLVRMGARDYWKKLETTRFRDPMPLEGTTITDALERVLSVAGVEAANTDIEAETFELPLSPSPSTGEWATLIEPDEEGTPAHWVERLIETYCATWIYGFKPTLTGTKFMAKSPDEIGTTPLATLYSKRSDAIAIGLHTAEEASRFVYRRARQTALEPEANDVRVTGWDGRTQRAIQSYYPDAASQDPGLAVVDRPENWLGEVRSLGIFDPMITSQEACDRAATIIFDRVSRVRRMCEWECDFILGTDGVPAWRGDCVELDGIGTFRIVSLSVRFERDYDDGAGVVWRWYPARYVGEKV